MSVNENRSNRCIVVKFGGSSLTDGPSILRAVNSLIKEKMRGSQIAVVVSAMGKTTDLLISTASQACGSDFPREALDDIMAIGERTSARIFAAALRAKGLKSCYLDPSDPNWPIITDESFNNAKPILHLCAEMIKESVQPLMNDGVIVVIPGFIGKTQKGSITTMGRGGSDVTTMILARCLSAQRAILVTDVDGIMSADPKIVERPQTLKEIEIDSLVGLADSGSKFIHKKALRYKSPEIDVKVISNASGDLSSEGTTIRGSFPENIVVKPYPETSMAVTIVGKAISESPRTLQDILQQIKRFNVSIRGMSINHNSLILYLPTDSSGELLEALHSIVVADERTIAMAVRKNLAFVDVKGLGLEETPGIVSAITGALSQAGVNLYGVFTITSSVLLFTDLKDREKAIQLIKDSLKESRTLVDEEK